ncbi:MAG: 16S rRNA (adenine(1518)-N(6)/adenine(1519)-N(6))-dimethyltransferase RsmA [Phycisphaerae bacterium]
MLAVAGVRPRRRWGQHFLIDGNLLRRLLQSAEPRPEDAVLEVGAGTGALTEHLVRAAGAVVAVEIDPALCGIVAERLQDADNLTLVRGDVLTSKHLISPVVREALLRSAVEPPGRLMLVANLPYQIATPLLIDLLLDEFGFARFCITVQQEVADRLAGAPRTKQYGPVSVLVQATCDVARLAALPPSVFWPQPKVASAMLRIDVARNPFETRERLNRFSALLRGSFAHRRKTLRYNLQRALDEDRCRILEETYDLSRRPEALGVDEWVALGRHVETLQ